MITMAYQYISNTQKVSIIAFCVSYSMSSGFSKHYLKSPKYDFDVHQGQKY